MGAPGSTERAIPQVSENIGDSRPGLGCSDPELMVLVCIVEHSELLKVHPEPQHISQACL